MKSMRMESSGARFQEQHNDAAHTLHGVGMLDEKTTVSAKHVVKVASDGTLWRRMRDEESADEALLMRMAQERSVLGTSSVEEIALRPSLPLGAMTPWDHVLPATLAALPLTGDLAPYGWRVGTGAGSQWHANRAFHNRMFEAARMAYAGYHGSIGITRFGPALLASGTFVGNGEKTLSDRGLVRELPYILGESLHETAESLASRLPGASPVVVCDERGAQRVIEGTVRTVSGYRFYKPVGTAGMSELWGRLMSVLPADIQRSTTILIDSRVESLTAALDAGVRSIGIDPWAGELRAAGQLWEQVAEAYERGVELTMCLRSDRLEPTARHLLDMWQRLGYQLAEARGFTLMVTKGAHASSSALPAESQFVDSHNIDALMRLALVFAEKVAG